MRWERKEAFFNYRNLGPTLLALMVAGGVAIIISLLAVGFGDKETVKQLGFSWLYAYTYFFTIAIGGLFWVLVHHATDAAWSTVIRRQYENLANLLPVLAVFFLPILFLAPHIYKWMSVMPGEDPIWDDKQPYLQTWFFVVRTVVYFVVFILAAWLVRRYSVAQDTSGDPQCTIKLRRVTFASMPFFALALTFAAVDWLMTLDFHWFSTMWGVYIFAGSALASVSVMILVISALCNAGYLRNVVSVEHYHILGKLLLAFTIFWAYIGFSQYMLIWYANIPEETYYFYRRNVESWHTLNLILVAGHFFLPFLCLLARRSKKSPKFLCAIAAWILVMHWLDIYIIVMPILHPEGFRPHYLDLVTLVAIGAPLVLVFFRLLGRSALYPLRDPRLGESLRLTN